MVSLDIYLPKSNERSADRVSLSDLFRYAVRFDEGLDHVIVIDGVPIVDETRKDRLFETIKKRFKSQTGLDVDINGFHLPFGSDGQSKG